MILNELFALALHNGVTIPRYRQDTVRQQYRRYKIPASVLSAMSSAALQEYVDGLYLCGCYAASDWTQGHEKLKNLGFEEVEREDGPRVFVSLRYVGND